MSAVDLKYLPPPGLGNLQELLFRRLLAKCYSQQESVGELDWRRDPRYHHFVGTLRKYLEQLKRQVAGQHSEDAEITLTAYDAAVAEIANQLELPDVPPYVEPAPDPPPSSVARAPGHHASDSAERVIAALQGNGLGANTRLLNARVLDEASQARLRAQEDIQEALTDDLLVMSAALKDGARAISSGLAARDARMDAASDKLARAAEGAKAAQAGTKTALKRSRRSFWFSLFIMFAVGGAFLGMFAFIRVTSFAKYWVPWHTLSQGLFVPSSRPAKLGQPLRAQPPSHATPHAAGSHSGEPTVTPPGAEAVKLPHVTSAGMNTRLVGEEPASDEAVAPLEVYQEQEPLGGDEAGDESEGQAQLGLESLGDDASSFTAHAEVAGADEEAGADADEALHSADAVAGDVAGQAAEDSRGDADDGARAQEGDGIPAAEELRSAGGDAGPDSSVPLQSADASASGAPPGAPAGDPPLDQPPLPQPLPGSAQRQPPGADPPRDAGQGARGAGRSGAFDQASAAARRRAAAARMGGRRFEEAQRRPPPDGRVGGRGRGNSRAAAARGGLAETTAPGEEDPPAGDAAPEEALQTDDASGHSAAAAEALQADDASNDAGVERDGEAVVGMSEDEPAVHGDRTGYEVDASEEAQEHYAEAVAPDEVNAGAEADGAHEPLMDAVELDAAAPDARTAALEAADVATDAGDDSAIPTGGVQSGDLQSDQTADAAAVTGAEDDETAEHDLAAEALGVTGADDDQAVAAAGTTGAIADDERTLGDVEAPAHGDEASAAQGAAPAEGDSCSDGSCASGADQHSTAGGELAQVADGAGAVQHASAAAGADVGDDIADDSPKMSGSDADVEGALGHTAPGSAFADESDSMEGGAGDDGDRPGAAAEEEGTVMESEMSETEGVEPDVALLSDAIAGGDHADDQARDEL